MSDVTDLLEYIRLCQEHDHSFEFTDDPRVWRNGLAELNEIKRRQPTIDPGWKVWNECVPEYFRRKA
jgi:hypothetical protein